ncbi:MAG: hypothetical protein P1V97_17250 [Planctomycetota bacterium]|nr:hypothetical protein [Planctomycetota bacterium]
MNAKIWVSVFALAILTSPCQASDTEEEIKRFIETAEQKRQSWQMVASYLSNSR